MKVYTRAEAKRARKVPVVVNQTKIYPNGQTASVMLERHEAEEMYHSLKSRGAFPVLVHHEYERTDRWEVWRDKGFVKRLHPDTDPRNVAKWLNC